MIAAWVNIADSGHAARVGAHISPSPRRLAGFTSIVARYPDHAAVIALLVLAVVALQPAFGTGFSLVDDHEILSYSPVTIRHPQVNSPAGLIERVLVDDPTSGRVRPLYWIIRFGEIALLGDVPLLWHGLYILLGVVSAGLLYGALQSAGMNRSGAFVAAAWILIAPGASSVWMRLGPQEGLGTLFLVMAMWAAVRAAQPGRGLRWDVLHVAATAAASLTKESFVLAVPAMVGFRLFVRTRSAGGMSMRSARTLAPALVTLAFGLAALVATVLVARSAGASSYGGQFLSLSAADLETSLVNVGTLMSFGGLVLVLPLLTALLDALRRRWTSNDSNDWAWGVCLFGLLVFPQLLLYRQGGGFDVVGRYILPAGIGVAMGLGAGLAWLGHGRRVLVWGVMVALCALTLGWGALLTHGGAESLRADSAAVESVVTTIGGSAPRNASIWISVNSVNQVELAMSLVRHLAHQGRDDLELRVLLAQPPDKTGDQAAALASMIGAYFPGRVDTDSPGCASIWGVVLLSSERAAADAAPCLSDRSYHRLAFSGRIWGIEPGAAPAYQLLVRSA